MIGMMISPTSEVTIAPKAAPMMTPTARSTTLPFMANSRNSFSMLNPLLRSTDEARSKFFILTRFLHANRFPLRSKTLLVDEARMHHGVADDDAGWRRHRHQREAHLFLEPSQQLEAMLGAGEARLL